MTTPVPPAAPYAPKTNTLSIVALILGFVAAPIGIILGFVALNQIKTSGEGGRGLALTGIIAGFVITAFYIIGIILYFITLASLAGISGTYGY